MDNKAMSRQRVAKQQSGNARNDGDEKIAGDEELSSRKSALSMIACVLAGITFGFAVEKGRVFEPAAVRGQMSFSRFIMLKMFLSAVATGMVGMSIVSMLPFGKPKFDQMRVRFFRKFVGKRGVLAAGLGGFIHGVGMTICASCPGVLYIQLGTGTPNAVLTLCGALSGAFLYGMVELTVVRLSKPGAVACSNTLDQFLGTPYFVAALPIAAMLATCVFALELFQPWGSDLTQPNSAVASALELRAWPPYLSGMLAGSVQGVLVLTLGDVIGSSTSYAALASLVLVTEKMERLSPYLRSYKRSPAAWAQVLFCLSSVLGGFLSASFSGAYGTVPGVTGLAAYLGGVIMVFGARTASGCTSGHGLSGSGILFLLSFVVLPAMYLGGVLTAAVMSVLQGQV
ncbi:PREDICTED: uncharacterized protein LOC109469179 isoform X2 [Branchiostoma belcheri]|nr:PREDICTED: uncharacterized protein LOC109469179 isoform X2 [Branchiostoma belcheri]XP_019623164.1 PREDICTED: uncharacterized protein LOC109469179 isoform X2 [Branchiostoma belcheri]XP_019623165.1 PREDICTED: uncharacterized protein LOC109469179 isoform X2 [Branchiostoma belcheri]